MTADTENRSDASMIKIKLKKSSMRSVKNLICFPHNPKTVQSNPVYNYKRKTIKMTTQGFTTDPHKHKPNQNLNIEIATSVRQRSCTIYILGTYGTDGQSVSISIGARLRLAVLTRVDGK